MIINRNTKEVQDIIGCNYNWLDDEWIYVETGSELGDKIMNSAPYITELMFDENGNLIDVETTEPPDPTPTETIDTNETLLDHEYRITMLELGI